ncbi:hypothetical protein Ddye_000905 [Dipteronia dyeriana]|uniref:Uncharacterized protein n=1 Tax=Dipteronia dyeriana TaxID=168575 RepID=A0AAD9XN35_9ROSI|nr:hypothetical protein Ddye_000905 [Dipteronia dyeriana]
MMELPQKQPMDNTTGKLHLPMHHKEMLKTRRHEPPTVFICKIYRDTVQRVVYIGEGIQKASKAALISFFETLRMEMGGDIGITIVTPGLIKSEMSLSASSPKAIPTESKEECAKAIVKSGCRGDKYLVEPSWVRIIFPWKAFCTELTEYCNRCLALTPRRHTIANSNLTQSTYHKTE